MTIFEEARIRLTWTQLNKLKSAFELLERWRISTWAISNDKTMKMFASNVSTYVKFSKVQICKIIQSGGSFDSWLGSLDTKQ